MKHTECKDCELSNGDCGYHFKMDGKTTFDIASLSACDKYGNCEFFKSKANPSGDLISREALKKTVERELANDGYGIRRFTEIIDNAPTVDTKDCEGCPYGPNSNSGIPVKELKRYFRDFEG